MYNTQWQMVSTGSTELLVNCPLVKQKRAMALQLFLYLCRISAPLIYSNSYVNRFHNTTNKMGMAI